MVKRSSGGIFQDVYHKEQHEKDMELKPKKKKSQTKYLSEKVYR